MGQDKASDNDLTTEVHDLNDRLDAATGAMSEAADATKLLALKYAADKEFRQFVTKSLFGFSVILTVITLVSGWTALQVRSDQQSERLARCEQSRNLRADIHAGVDAVLDEISLALDDPEAAIIFSKAKEAIRLEVPNVNCDGKPVGTTGGP